MLDNRKDFNFQLFWVLRVPTLSFDGSPILQVYLIFYSNSSGCGVSTSYASDLDVKKLPIDLLLGSSSSSCRTAH